MVGFDSKKYIKLQTKAILERLAKFPNGKLYFEIGGKFLHDEHAARVLPGYFVDTKLQILKKLEDRISIIYCIKSDDIENERVWENGLTYEQSLYEGLNDIIKAGLPKPKIVFNLFDAKHSLAKKLSEKLNKDGYKTFFRYKIADYPSDEDLAISENGFGKDDYVECEGHIVLVCALGSNSGKMSTCLGQVYLDREKFNRDSGYAKYETFPIWNLPLNHPINIAYEAATVDIADFNVVDKFYLQAYGKEAVNYNRDVDAFPVLDRLIKKVISPSNFMHNYKSPTDMGINQAGFCIVDEKVCIDAAIEEIKRRKAEYSKLDVDPQIMRNWMVQFDKLLAKAKLYKIG